MSRAKRIILICVIAVTAFLIAGIWILSVAIYNENLNVRLESYVPLMLQPEDFEGLERTRYEFPSDKGQMLTGYLYSHAQEPRGIIILAHGFGAGHNSYMNCADYFAKNGYLVFAYDATGNDESEGAGTGGTPQGVADLDAAISFVEESGSFPDLPIGLFGHSWGGYSVLSVLSFHPEVQAVIECSGFNRSSDMFEAGGRDQAGDAISLFMPFVRLHEFLQYGSYASNTALDGMAVSEAAIMIVHSADDDVIPIEYGYDVFFEKYADDSRFAFLRLEHEGHNYILNDRTYIDEFNTAFDSWRETLGYDYHLDENRERFAEDKEEYIRTHLDREKWANSLNTELFELFLDFYNENLG